MVNLTRFLLVPHNRNNFDNLWQPKGHVTSVLQNGVGRYINQLKRVTFFFTKDRSDSAGIRQFIQDGLVDFANANPGTVVYIIPRRNQAPYLLGEYLNGREASIVLKNNDKDTVKRWLNYLRTRSGQTIVKFDQNWRTMHPSIQGMWHPFLNQPTDINLRKFPNKEMSEHYTTLEEWTATEKILAMVKENKNIVLENTDKERCSSTS